MSSANNTEAAALMNEGTEIDLCIATLNLSLSAVLKQIGCEP